MHLPDSFILAFAVATDSPATRIPFVMLLVFGSAKVLAELFERLGQPGIVGEILAGVLIGPGVLGWVAPDDFLRALANLGVMFLLFRVGLDIKSSELMKVGGTAALVATLGVILPFLMGWGLLIWWGTSQIEAIFVGAAMVATSVGITAQVLAAKDLLRARASKIILGAAVIDDVLGLLVLAAVGSMARGKVDFLQLTLTGVLAIGFTIVVATWGTKSMSKIVPVYEKLRVGEAQFAFSLVLLFSLALLSVFVGIAAIVGAFLAGLALSENVGTRVKDLTLGVTELLVPFFLVDIGLHVALDVFANGATMILALLLVLAAIASKFFGCGFGALRLGKLDALRVGVGMIPRGEVGMVVAQLGLVLGVIPRDVYSVVIFMAIATTIAAPPLIKLAFAGAGRPVPEQEGAFHIE